MWVNRHAAFLQLKQSCPGLTATWAEQTLFEFLGGNADYFHMPDADAAAPAEAKNFVQKAGGWLSHNWGSGEKSDASTISESLRSLSEINAVEIVGKSGRQALIRLHGALVSCDDEIKPADEAFKSLKASGG